MEQKGKADPADSKVRMRIAETEDALGHVYLAMNRLGEARESFTKFRDAQDAIVAATKPATDARRHLSHAYSDLGDLSLKRGDLATGLKYFEDTLDQDSRWYNDQAGGLTARFILSWDFVDVGRVALLEGNLGRARDKYARSLELRKECASESPNEFYKKHVALALARLGELEQTAGNSDKARASYNQALAIAEGAVDQGHCRPFRAEVAR